MTGHSPLSPCPTLRASGPAKTPLPSARDLADLAPALLRLDDRDPAGWPGFGANRGGGGTGGNDHPNLPTPDLADYRPASPSVALTSDGILMGEFGEERRNLTLYLDHSEGDEGRGAGRGGCALLHARWRRLQGRDPRRPGRQPEPHQEPGRVDHLDAGGPGNVYLSSKKTLTRKIYEIPPTFKLEHQLTKDQIFEIYLNQIYLGNRAYGFAAASEAYFGKPLKDITTAQAAMPRGLPAHRAPTTRSRIRAARGRQLYVIDRMVEAGFITEQEAGGPQGRTPPARRPGAGPAACRVRRRDGAPAHGRPARR